MAADEITPMLLCPPRAVGLAGIASAVLIGLVLALLAGVMLPVRGTFLPWLVGAVRT
jgi:hypothetical protein